MVCDTLCARQCAPLMGPSRVKRPWLQLPVLDYTGASVPLWEACLASHLAFVPQSLGLRALLPCPARPARCDGRHTAPCTGLTGTWLPSAPRAMKGDDRSATFGHLGVVFHGSRHSKCTTKNRRAVCDAVRLCAGACRSVIEESMDCLHPCYTPTYYQPIWDTLLSILRSYV